MVKMYSLKFDLHLYDRDGWKLWRCTDWRSWPSLWLCSDIKRLERLSMKNSLGRLRTSWTRLMRSDWRKQLRRRRKGILLVRKLTSTAWVQTVTACSRYDNLLALFNFFLTRKYSALTWNTLIKSGILCGCSVVRWRFFSIPSCFQRGKWRSCSVWRSTAQVLTSWRSFRSVTSRPQPLVGAIRGTIDPSAMGHQLSIITFNTQEFHSLWSPLHL